VDQLIAEQLKKVEPSLVYYEKRKVTLKQQFETSRRAGCSIQRGQDSCRGSTSTKWLAN
jgi:hypothetical protein